MKQVGKVKEKQRCKTIYAFKDANGVMYVNQPNKFHMLFKIER